MRPTLSENPLSSLLHPSFVCGLLLLACSSGCGMSSGLFVAESDAPDDGADDAPGGKPKDAGIREGDAGGDAGTGSVGSGSGSAGDPVRRLPCGTGPGCDPSDLGGESCQTLGLGQGTLLCNTSTCTFETQLCQGLGELPPCGSGPGCDTTKLGGATCESLGMPAGVLSCDPVTCAYDTSGCIAAAPGLLGGGLLGGGLFGGATATDEDGGTAPFFGGGGGLFGTAGGGLGGIPGAAAEPTRTP